MFIISSSTTYNLLEYSYTALLVPGDLSVVRIQYPICAYGRYYYIYPIKMVYTS